MTKRELLSGLRNVEFEDRVCCAHPHDAVYSAKRGSNHWLHIIDVNSDAGSAMTKRELLSGLRNVKFEDRVSFAHPHDAVYSAKKGSNHWLHIMDVNYDAGSDELASVTGTPYLILIAC
jgi:hypothetical protein